MVPEWLVFLSQYLKIEKVGDQAYVGLLPARLRGHWILE